MREYSETKAIIARTTINNQAKEHSPLKTTTIHSFKSMVLDHEIIYIVTSFSCSPCTQPGNKSGNYNFRKIVIQHLLEYSCWDFQLPE